MGKGLLPQNIKLGSNGLLGLHPKFRSWLTHKFRIGRWYMETTEIEYLAALEVVENSPINKKHKEN